MKLINIGFGNMVNADRVIAVVSPDSAPIKRIVQDARDKGAAIDATYGRRTRAVIITDSDHVVLSAFEPEEVLGRFEKEQDKPRLTLAATSFLSLSSKNEQVRGTRDEYSKKRELTLRSSTTISRPFKTCSARP